MSFINILYFVGGFIVGIAFNFTLAVLIVGMEIKKK